MTVTIDIRFNDILNNCSRCGNNIVVVGIEYDSFWFHEGGGISGTIFESGGINGTIYENGGINGTIYENMGYILSAISNETILDSWPDHTSLHAQL